MHNKKDQRRQDPQQYKEDKLRPYKTRRIRGGRIIDNTEKRETRSIRRGKDQQQFKEEWLMPYKTRSIKGGSIRDNTGK